MLARLATVALLASVLGCAHGPPAGSVETLKPAVDTFFKRVRWRDYRGAAELLVPERRAAFEHARMANHDERDLEITDYELQDLRMTPGGRRATAVVRVSWTRLPSVSVSTETISSEFVFRDGTWWLARQDVGPFAAELSTPVDDTVPSSR